MSRHQDTRTPQQRLRDKLTLELAGAIALLLAAVIREVLKERTR